MDHGHHHHEGTTGMSGHEHHHDMTGHHHDMSGMTGGHHHDMSGMTGGHHHDMSGMSGMSGMTGHSHDHGGGMHMGGMHMTFYQGYHNIDVLFKWWHVDGMGAYIGTLIGIVCLGILYEFLRAFFLKYRLSMWKKQADSELLPSSHGERNTTLRYLSWTQQLSLTGLHTANELFHYLLMLVFMLYNVGMCLAVLVGMAIGHFLFFRNVPATVSASQCEH